MDFNQQKEQLLKKISFIKVNLVNKNNLTIIKKLTDLENDIENDFFSIVVLGEFKRGKSTFVNALIGEKLLPADVLPTTATINALMWDIERKTYVVKNNGEVETGATSLQFLNNFVAGDTKSVDNIKYLKIGHPAEILKNDVVIVDTPGVSDINEQRVQVTYDFIPKANAVIFLLDATSPLKRSEKEFIDEHLIKLGIDRILFIANKFDDVDEDEEEAVLEDLERRLIAAFRQNDKKLTLKDIAVLPMSSIWALKGIENNNEKLIEQSGLKAVKAKINNIIATGSVAEEKIKRYKFRLNDILSSIQRDIDNQISLQQTNIADLKIMLSNMDKMVSEQEKRKTIIREYIETEQQNILAMTKKSLVHFHAKLKEEIDDSIERYKGSDFKNYIEKSITLLIKKNMERWVSTYFAAIDQLLERLEREVSKGLAIYFKRRVTLNNSPGGELITVNKAGYLINVEAEDVSTATTHAGLISAGAAGIIMLIGGSILTPLISMAAFPLLQKKFLEEKLKNAKLSIKPELNQQLIKCMYNLSLEVVGNINDRVESIKQSSEQTYNSLFKNIKEQVQAEINRKEKMREDLKQNVFELEAKLKEVKKLKENLQ